MNRYRGARLARTGFLGVVTVILVIAVGLQPEQLISWASSLRYQARFAEAGGLSSGNDVVLSGLKVGQVTDIALDQDSGEAVVKFSVPADIELGSTTTAHIRTGTLLGERVLVLESSGPGNLRANQVIPSSRTSSPYSLNDAVGDLAANVSDIDTHAINQSLDTLSSTIDRIAPQLGPTFDGVTRVSRSLNERNESLTALLQASSKVSGVLADHSQQVDSLILNSNELLGELVERRRAIVALLASTHAVAQQISGLVADNEKQLAPMLEKLNSVTEMLEHNRDSLAKAIPGLAKYQVTQGETVANGPYYTAFVGNVLPSQLLQPFLDYAFGFRRGTDAGQPPDNAGPRAQFPIPRNGIPGGSR